MGHWFLQTDKVFRIQRPGRAKIRRVADLEQGQVGLWQFPGHGESVVETLTHCAVGTVCSYEHIRLMECVVSAPDRDLVLVLEDRLYLVVHEDPFLGNMREQD